MAESKIRLLVVEDEAVIRSGIKRHMSWEELGVDEVYTAENGREALEITREKDMDIIISDIRMPGMSGIELCEIFRKRWEKCQIIFISGFTDKEYFMSAIELGAVRYVEKPIDMEALSKAVKQGVHTVQQTKQILQVHLIQEYHSEECESTQSRFAVQKVITYMEEHLEDPALSIQMLADEVYLTPTYLSSLFKKTTGVTIGQYLTEQRINRARELLDNPRWKLYHIAEMVGYRDANYFAKIFKKRMGILPSEYRERQPV
ncbi:MAG: response regulator [Lachnospiraceae bacterium]|nr:response regulator [Lachnospiraceae bacterium]